MPRLINNKTALELAGKGDASYEEKTDPVAINRNVAQVLKSCNDIVASVSSYYETFIDVDAGASIKKEMAELAALIKATKPSAGGSNDQVVAACDSMNASINQMAGICNSIMMNVKNYHESVIAKTNVAPDMSQIQEMNKKLTSLIQLESSKNTTRKGKEWDFDAVRDMNGNFHIKAREVTH